MQLQGEITNYKLSELEQALPEELELQSNYFKYLKPIAKIGKYKAPDLYEMEFAEVVNIKNAMKAENYFEAVHLFYRIPKYYLLKIRVIEYTHALNYLTKEMDVLIAREVKALTSEPDQDWIEAGVRNLDRFGPLNVLDDLGQEFGKSPLEVERWPYGLVFGLLWRRTIKADINERYREITKSKK